MWCLRDFSMALSFHDVFPANTDVIIVTRRHCRMDGWLPSCFNLCRHSQDLRQLGWMLMDKRIPVLYGVVLKSSKYAISGSNIAVFPWSLVDDRQTQPCPEVWQNSVGIWGCWPQCHDPAHPLGAKIQHPSVLGENVYILWQFLMNFWVFQSVKESCKNYFDIALLFLISHPQTFLEMFCPQWNRLGLTMLFTAGSFLSRNSTLKPFLVQECQQEGR